MIRAPGFADPGIKKAQVVIYFGHGADRGSGIMGCRFLLNTDRGRQTFDEIDIRFFHQREELPRVGRQRLYIAALAFGINGVKGQGGFPRSRQARNHDQFIARQVDVDTLQIVGSGPTDLDVAHSCWVAKRQTVNITSLVSPGSKAFHVLLARPVLKSVQHRHSQAGVLDFHLG